MAAYKFLAVDGGGREHKGLLEADSPRAARAQLRERGLIPLEVDSVAAPGRGVSLLSRGLPRAELVMLTQQLATLLEAGLPLERALAAIAEQAEHPRTRAVLAQVRSDILEGKSLAQAMASAPAVFNHLYRSLILAGEQTGNLARVMVKLADYLEQRQHTQQKVALAMAYPLVVTVVALLVVGGLMAYVVPQVVSVFAQSKQSLPFLTRALVASSHFLREWGWLLLLALTTLAAGCWRVLRIPAVKARWHRLLLKTPVIGRFLQALNTARMGSTLAILVGSGVPLLTALETARGIVSLLPMQAALSDTMARVREGAALSRALAATQQFPPVLIHLIGSGESSGRLADMIDRAALQQQNEVERKLATFTTLMEPLLILLMGGMVLMIVLAIMMPIIDMNQMVR